MYSEGGGGEIEKAKENKTVQSGNFQCWHSIHIFLRN